MNMQKSLMVLAGAALGLSSVAAAQSDSPATSELKTDAATRSSFQGDSAMPTLKLSGYTQFQFNLNYRDDSDANAGIPGGTHTDDPSDDEGDVRNDSMTTGFRFAATKLVAKGNITEEWSYKLQGAFGTDGGAFALEDMYGQYTADNGFNVQVGQKKLPFLKEELVADTGQQAAERSIIDEKFSAARAQGVFLNYDAENFRVMGAFSDGAFTPNTEFTSTSEADYAFTARGEWKWAGDWSRFDQYSSWNGAENAGEVGGALHYQDGGSTVGTSDTSVLGATIDAMIQGSGWNVAGAAVYSYVDVNAPGVDSIADLGLQVQGGFFVTDDWEIFGRGNYIMPDDDKPERDDFYTVTAGANYFITPNSQAAKLTVEVIYAGEATVITSGENAGAQNVSPSTNAGVLPDAEGGQFTLRGQLQLMF